MSPTNGHANDPNGSTNTVQQLAPPASDANIPFHLHFVSVTRDTDGGNTTPGATMNVCEAFLKQIQLAGALRVGYTPYFVALNP
jgi:hypothetical protein